MAMHGQHATAIGRRRLLRAAGTFSVAGAMGILQTGCGNNNQPGAVTRNTKSSTTQVVPNAKRALLFDAELTALSSTERYADHINTGISPVTNQPRSQVIDDPVHGKARKVLRLASDELATIPGNSNPRVKLESRHFIRSAREGHESDIYYVGFSLYLPDEFQELFSGDWISFAAGAYGPPYQGHGPLTFSIDPPLEAGGEHLLVLGNSLDLSPDIRLPRNRWIDLVLGFKFAYAEDGGWVSLWSNSGSGWHQVALNGRSKLKYDSLAQGVNDAWHNRQSRTANATGLTVYGNKPNTLIHGWHRVGRFPQDVMPYSYPGSKLSLDI